MKTHDRMYFKLEVGIPDEAWSSISEQIKNEVGYDKIND